MPSYFLTIPGEPRTKKNSPRPVYAAGRFYVVPSKAYEEYKNAAMMLVKRPETPISGPVNVEMVFYMATKRKVDLSNLEAGCLDLLVECGVLEDDNCSVVASQDGSRVVLGVGKDNARVEVCIRGEDRH